MTDTNKALKPCPFCGTEPDWKRWEVGGIWQINIFCDGEGCHVHPSILGNEKTMSEIWNTRAAPNPQPVNAAVEIEIGDIVQFFAASHPLNEPTEYIGRVERDYKGLHAANRYLPIKGVRIIEKGKIK